MSGFKDMVARDNFGVFLNCDEFAEKLSDGWHTMIGETTGRPTRIFPSSSPA